MPFLQACFGESFENGFVERLGESFDASFEEGFKGGLGESFTGGFEENRYILTFFLIVGDKYTLVYGKCTRFGDFFFIAIM